MNQINEVLDNYAIERQLWQEGYRRIMGLDEVGRGCLAGPVVAAGVILDPETNIQGIRDSKKLDAETRLELSKVIKEKALFWSVGESSVQEINSLNILRASLLAMRRCTESEGALADFLLVDGNRYMDTLIPHSCIVSGDDISASIGAASILAKVYRDELMRQLHEHFPHYGWNTNVGYPTKMHQSGLKKCGFCEHHRTGFRLGTFKKLQTQ
jgi:ribonuclease HII